MFSLRLSILRELTPRMTANSALLLPGATAEPKGNVHRIIAGGLGYWLTLRRKNALPAEAMGYRARQVSVPLAVATNS